MRLPKIAKVAVEQAAFHFDKFYDYCLPEALEPVEPGCRVLVPFGGGNRKRQGLVVGFSETAEVDRLKPIAAVLDREPLLSPEMLQLALWLRERTFCSAFDAVRAMLPTGLYMRIRPVYRLAVNPFPADCTPEERRMLAEVAKSGEGIDREKLLKRLGLSSDHPLPDQLVEKGWLHKLDSAARLVGDATLQMVRLLLTGDQLREEIAVQKCTPKQKAVLSLLEEVGCASVKELCYFCSVTPSVPAALEKKGFLEYYEAEVLRSPTRERDCPPLVSTRLNEEQQKAFEELLQLYRQHRAAVSLLYGVTGSGKTQVYMNLIDQVVEDGRQVIVLVPEISLTPQMMNLFRLRYGSRVAVLHSALAIGERLDEWKRVRRGDARIVVGTRSAVFAPCENLGLVILDEEQEHTYKSESSPRYHARDVAKYRCAQNGALLLLASATPSVESYHAAVSGRYTLHTLSSRYGAASLPEVEVVDMRAEPPAVEGGALSLRLKEEIDNCLCHGEQAILLLNRRGYHTAVSCRQCGYVFTCPSCSVSLTYHRANGRMMCHYCGYSREPVSVCPECGSDKIRYAGLGTQRVEQELERLFPGESVLRMDTDTTMSRFAYERKFGDFAKGKYGLMIGTQMVAKGLDFPRVRLVGVLSADQSLYGGDFRCFETTFSLLTQVIGRAGRRDRPGKALIQTYTPENYVIELAARQDYPAFYETEIAARKMMKYPPYTDLCLFGFVGEKEESVRAACTRFLGMLREAATGRYAGIPLIALDPSPASVLKAAGKYRYKLLVKTVCHTRTREMIGSLLNAFSRAPENRGVSMFVDINPASML